MKRILKSSGGFALSAATGITAVLLAFASCKKTEFPGYFNDPVFKINFESDSGYSVTAGLNDIYLFTRYDQGQGFFHSYNTFSKTGCPDGDCPGSLGFEFIESLSVDTAFFPGAYQYKLPDSLSSSPLYYNGKFKWTGQPFSSLDYQALILDGNSPLTVTSFSPDSQIIKIPPGESYVTFTASRNDTPSCTIRRQISASEPGKYPYVNIRANPIGAVYLLKALPGVTGAPPFKFLWSTQDTSSVIASDSLSLLNNYSVTVTDVNGNTASAAFSGLPFPTNVVYETANFDLSAGVVFNDHQLGTIALQWVDSEGVIWRSDRDRQPPNAYFHVLEQTSYDPNENGVPARKLKVEFKCKLFRENGLSSDFMGSGMVAMARP